MKILGIDPGLQKTGWGIILSEGNTLKLIAYGLIKPKISDPLARRLAQIDQKLTKIIQDFKPQTVAVEETFVNRNPATSLKLGMARGVVMAVPARHNLDVFEYPANLVKKSIVGTGHADKTQIMMMIDMLLPGKNEMGADEADALAVAICHAHHAASYAQVSKGMMQ